MTPENHADPANAVFKLKNTIWAFPYLAVMGLIWGYLAGASSGAIVGLAAAVAISVLIGSATPIFAKTAASTHHPIIILILTFLNNSFGWYGKAREG